MKNDDGSVDLYFGPHPASGKPEANWIVAPLAHAAVPRDAREIAKEAYLYAFAMLENYQTWYKQAVDAKAPEYIG